MRRIVSIVPAAALVSAALLGGCESNERTVYVPSSTSGVLVAGDPLGMQLMRRASANSPTYTQASSWQSNRSTSVEPVAYAVAQPQSARFVSASQGGQVTMASNYPSYGKLRDSEVRMPIATFAATDGPSAD